MFTESAMLGHFWQSEFKTPKVCSCSLRHIEHLETPFCLTSCGRSMRQYYIPHIFNNLPESVLGLPSWSVEKRAAKYDWLSPYACRHFSFFSLVVFIFCVLFLVCMFPVYLFFVCRFSRFCNTCLYGFGRLASFIAQLLLLIKIIIIGSKRAC